jgi:hypothetical protein
MHHFEKKTKKSRSIFGLIYCKLKFAIVHNHTNHKKMGIEYYNCTECECVFADCIDYETCCSCGAHFCGDCDGTQKVPYKKCNGDCIENTGWTEHENEEENGCKCADAVKRVYEQGCNNDYDCENQECHRICKKCLHVEDPDAVDDTELIDFLVAKLNEFESEYESADHARAECKEEKKTKRQNLALNDFIKKTIKQLEQEYE